MERNKMQKHLADSTAGNGAGIGPGKKVFKVKTGQYAGRIVVLMQLSPTQVKMTYADPPYNSWAVMSNALNDCADNSFDAIMDSEHNIYIVYTLSADGKLACRKLWFFHGLWSVGEASVIYDSDTNLNPSIEIQQPGILWVSWTRIASGAYYINAKHSADWGENWGNGPSSYGYEIASGTSSAWSRLQSMGSYIYVFYTIDGTRLSSRRKHIFIELWESEGDIATGFGFDDNFDSAITVDDRIGIVFDNSTLFYREFDGIKWSNVIEIDGNGGDFPQLRYYNNNPYIVYLSDFISNQRRILCRCRPGGSFTAPEDLTASHRVFEKVTCYNSTFAAYQDMTTQAGDDVAGDMYYPGTTALFKMPGDALYLGMSDRFHLLKIILSVPGSGGSLSWQYHNGHDWVGFEPSGGGYNFEDTSKDFLLWDDLLSAPDDWQKYSLNGDRCFWVRIVVASEFNTGPIGSHISAVANVGAIILMEN